MMHEDYIKKENPWFYAWLRGKGELFDYLEEIDNYIIKSGVIYRSKIDLI